MSPLVIVLVILGVLCLLFYASTRGTNPPITHTGQIKKKFLPEKTQGYHIRYGRFDISGVFFRKEDAIAFAAADDQTLMLLADPQNEYDRNSIKVIGACSTGNYFIGYVPKEIAGDIAKNANMELLRPSLTYIYKGHDDFVQIEMQILAPKVKKEKKIPSPRKKKADKIE